MWWLNVSLGLALIFVVYSVTVPSIVVSSLIVASGTVAVLTMLGALDELFGASGSTPNAVPLRGMAWRRGESMKCWEELMWLGWKQKCE